MKSINVLLLLVLIFAVNSELTGFEEQTCVGHAPSDLGGDGNPAFSLDFCRSTKTDAYRCCFLKYEKDNKRQYHCVPVTSSAFWDIDTTIETYRKNLNIEEIDSLDCSSSYLYVSLLLIFALLF